VRVSGNKTACIAKELTNKNLAASPRYAHYCKLIGEDVQVIDEGIVIYFSRPHSYTGEDVLEVIAHGSRIVLEMIVDRILALGARRATAGEFTERAFQNNRIDLVQAEAVADLIDATSVHAARSAVRSLEGEFSKRVNIIRDKLIRIRTLIEGTMDFSEEEIDFLNETDINQQLQDILSKLIHLLVRARQGVVLKEGIIISILGSPNVGKSTLLNRLAGSDVAIVTDVAGTTRDLVEKEILIDGIPLHVIDTAGLRKTTSKVEREGIKRAYDAAMHSDVILMVNECGRAAGKEKPSFLENKYIDQKIIYVHNKIDLTDQKPAVTKTDNHMAEVFLSAKTGAGFDLLITCLKEMLGVQELYEDVFMARQRHLDALERTKQSIEHASEKYLEHTAIELLADDLRLAQRTLNEITGEFAADDLLGAIFSKFCIGK
jgi:tRNA modification GTPase